MSLPPDLWISLLWSLTGALLGRAVLPLAERLNNATQRATSVSSPVATPTAQPVVIRRTTTARAATVSVPVTAVLFGLLAWRLGFGAELPAFSVMALIGVRLAMIDLAELRLPTALVLPLYPSISGLLGLAAVIDSAYLDLLRAVIGMIVLPGAYLTVALASRGGIGSGDIRLAGPVGLLLAWQSWTAVLIGTVLAFLYANIAVLARIAKGRVIRHIQVPFGPVMLGGMFTTVLVPTF
jgi:leader peptidase (prepilin peptidase)/N-methyltransferase